MRSYRADRQCTDAQWAQSARARGARRGWLERSHHSGTHGDGDVHAKLTAVPNTVCTGNDDHTKTHPQKILAPGALAVAHRTNPHRRHRNVYRFRKSRIQVIAGSLSWPSSWYMSTFCSLAPVASSPSPGAICHATLPRSWYTRAAVATAQYPYAVMPFASGHVSAAEGRR